MTSQPWHELPPTISGVLRPVLTEVADEVIEAIRQLPAYRRPVNGAFGAGLRAGVQEGLSHFLAEIEASGPVPRSDVYLALGRGEMRAGRSLESLLSAYRTGARVAWRRFVSAGVAAELAPQTLYLLAESIFAYIDVLSAESAEGHALEQSLVAGEAQLRRRRLVRLLIRDPPADPAIVEATAAEAGWPLPRWVAAVAMGGRGRDAVVAGLPADAVAETVGEVECVLLPDPDGPGRRLELEAAVRRLGARAAIGATVGWPELAFSFDVARGALQLAAESGVVVAARERAGELLLSRDPRLAREVAAARLAPLRALPAGSRQRLTETLRVWLAEQGRLGRTASELGVHPQTARYRLARLRELFGAALDDPDERFWLALALRVDDEGNG